ncbi:hypothetical protein GCM10010913_44680 [Paenibacillus aceti]|uniref:Uncharacterized protein n=2 Tax=Paenibacillus aceti TaxID=1820010 RepID=A0ABQ1W6K5_9BACL|nr:hypothetical protein GCM10010913_44680 [Paenibacillus aceti]
MYKGEITLGDIASFIGEDLITPFEYVVENGNYIFTGDPTKQEAYIYGEQLGKSNPWILLGIPLPEEQFCHQKLRQNSRSQPLLF